MMDTALCTAEFIASLQNAMTKISQAAKLHTLRNADKDFHFLLSS